MCQGTLKNVQTLADLLEGWLSIAKSLTPVITGHHRGFPQHLGGLDAKINAGHSGTW